MSLKENIAIKIVFAINNNYYLIKDKNLLKTLNIIKNKYQRYIKNNNVMNLNLYKIKRAFFDEFLYINKNPEKRALNNIINVFNSILDTNYNEEINNDANILRYYLSLKK